MTSCFPSCSDVQPALLGRATSSLKPVSMRMVNIAPLETSSHESLRALHHKGREAAVAAKLILVI
eukprot:CAMPEP_0195017320 /NCGR_PEP_ID=MMETSP0326_2-20130528/26928_1 /TAXON_ID=2866 ORGANISM="Crypthecodinium cohnii, Strain Seligo" /NCGR_SAMPLE_ID=MMETSP0326_2 /ASSEMBLY_ACC=CAM_ASM_000348 /LENGTH=64 /DNA_ID=CAMNT_0040033729 /DNA_START=184 /DNA_END=375 /DNA_ORIENTATION=-